MRYDITTDYPWVAASGPAGAWLKGICRPFSVPGPSSATYKVHSWRQYSGPTSTLDPTRPKWNYVAHKIIITGAPISGPSTIVSNKRAQSVVIEHAWCTFADGERPTDPFQLTNMDISWRPKLIRTRPGRPCHRGMMRSENAHRHHDS